MKKYQDLIQIILFMGIITGFMAAMFVLKDKTFSEQENRVLNQTPKVTVKGITSGKWMEQFEACLTDQFPGRDTWVGIKSYSERLSGKTENNAVFFCQDDTLIKRFDEPDSELVEKNIMAVNQLVENTDLPVYFSLIPGAVSIWDEKLPKYAQNYDQRALIDEIYSKVNCKTVDTYSRLRQHKNEYIFYRTDHHWTTRGAYYGSTAIAEAFGMEVEPLDSYSSEVVSDSFYGTVYSSSGVRWVKPDVIEKFIPKEGKTVQKFVGDTPADGEFYDYEKLKVKDKYAFFFGGNTPLIKITSDTDRDKKLLVIRDSYSDSEIPFLTEYFSEIYMMDLRYYKFGVKYFLEKYDVDAVLVNYSVSNFVEDKNIVMAGK